MNAKIKNIYYYLPKRLVTNKDLIAENPMWDLSSVAKNTGVEQRYFAEEGETALDLSVGACKKFFKESGVEPLQIDCILYCSQTHDYVMPGNSALLHRHFDFRMDVMAFDITLACSGYVYALTIAKSLIASSVVRNVIIVTADTYSKLIHKRDRSTRSLFGDAASVTYLVACNDEQGIIAQSLATEGKFYKKFYVPAGGFRNPKSESTSQDYIDNAGNMRSDENILMDGVGIWNFIRSKVPEHLFNFLDSRQLKIKDIDLFVFHQASALTLDSLQKALKIPDERMFRNIHKYGNTVSSSIPLALSEAIHEGYIMKGNLILVSGFGVGLSYGSALIQF
ncbi:MAG: ketoacyl-ACP synthase III [Bacteroidales bacterium]|nr:ketoacyl-ACP synthase III [Bacteroidales bacterium]